MSHEITEAMVRAAADAYLAEVFLPEDVGEKQVQLAMKLARKVLEAADRARKADTRRVASEEVTECSRCGRQRKIGEGKLPDWPQCCGLVCHCTCHNDPLYCRECKECDCHAS